MDTLNIFPTQIFYADWDGDTSSLLQYTKSNFFTENDNNLDQSRPDIYKDLNYRSLFDFLNTCLEEIRIDYQFKCDKFKITTAWINKYKPFSAIQFHRHPMSAWSGVFFLTEGAPFAVRDPVVYRSHQSTMPISTYDQPYYTIPPIPGRVIIFPHWLEHGAINDRDEERWSIAFNSMPHGRVNCDDGNDLSSAILSVSDYTDK